jgi:hypothetical protein
MPERIYSNAVRAHAGAFDVALDFVYELGDATEPPEPGVRVVMSWEHAAALVHVMGQLLAKYQEQLGPLPDLEKARVAQEGP